MGKIKLVYRTEDEVLYTYNSGGKEINIWIQKNRCIHLADVKDNLKRRDILDHEMFTEASIEAAKLYKSEF